MKTKVWVGDSEWKTQYLYRKCDKRDECLRNSALYLNMIDPPGIPPIKEFIMWNKFRPLIPIKYQHITFPEPSIDVKVKVRLKMKNMRIGKKKDDFFNCLSLK